MREAALKKYGFVSVQHGFISAARKHKYSNPECYFVWSDYFKNQLLDSGVKCDILISGNLQYQNMQTIKPKLLSKKKVLFLPNSGNSTTTEEEVRWATNTYLKMLKLDAILPFEVCIKPHPGDSNNIVISEAESFRLNFPNLEFILFEDSKNINFEEYDVVVTMNSTCAIEANLFGTPSVILLSSKNELMLPDLIAYNTQLLVHNERDLFFLTIGIMNNIKESSERAIGNSKKFFGEEMDGPQLISDKIKMILNE